MGVCHRKGISWDCGGTILIALGRTTSDMKGFAKRH